ncbi:glutathione synthetase [Mannheimia sp. AT1]|uniref:Glutathione synthetase n=1 Tax=Mannheimia cairinae TaxID=3025936 RepID=A0ABT5MS15_9PAST|nr:glutathione synthetase [Mannheimia cairinae]MDD0824974.1 glutathione synthetase [Mannheimia cairinae]MDD0827212.1 glutathione synthetase [Mannheimia cairinae]
MKTLRLTTCLKYPQLPQNLQPLVNQLSNDFKVEITPWQTTAQSDVILPLCAWDYAEQPELFQQWLRKMSAQGAVFLNSIALMQWNMNKRYLVDLQQWGIDVIPSQILPADPKVLQQTLLQQGWQDVVIKPVIGQSGRFVQKVCKNQPLVELEHYQSGIILQPYIPEVASNGETSLIFFGGEFSHSIKRQPAENEWRANSAYGVQISAQKVSESIIQQAQNVLTTLPEMPNYVRVDGTIIGERFLLNELELIEPALYLDKQDKVVQHFADMIRKVIQAV